MTGAVVEPLDEVHRSEARSVNPTPENNALEAAPVNMLIAYKIPVEAGVALYRIPLEPNAI